MPKEGKAEKLTRHLYTVTEGKSPKNSYSVVEQYHHTPKLGPDPTVGEKVKEDVKEDHPGVFIDSPYTKAEEIQLRINRANTQSAEQRRLQQEHDAHCR